MQSLPFSSALTLEIQDASPTLVERFGQAGTGQNATRSNRQEVGSDTQAL